MILAVEIAALRAATQGWTLAGGSATPVNLRLGLGASALETWLQWDLELDRRVGRNRQGRHLARRPSSG